MHSNMQLKTSLFHKGQDNLLCLLLVNTRTVIVSSMGRS